MRLCADLLRACRDFLSDDDKNYVLGNWDNIDSPVYYAARNGFADLLFSRSPIPRNGRFLTAAIRGGSMRCVRILREQCDNEWDTWSLAEAAETGSLRLVRYAVRTGCPFPSTRVMKAALWGGSAECFAFLGDNGGEEGRSIDIYDMLRQGNSGMVRYLLARGRKLPSDACNTAAANANIELLEFLHAEGCRLTAATCALAAHSLPTLRWLHANGCAWDARTCEEAAVRGEMQCLRFAHENGCPWDESTCTRAAARGDLPMLRFAHENGCSWSKQTLRAVVDTVRVGIVDVFKYLLDNDCPWDPDMYCNIIGYQDMNMFAYALERKKPADAHVCAAAASRNCAMLRMLREAGCEWDDQTYVCAIYTGRVDCYLFARENGCPWTQRAADVLLRCGTRDMLEATTFQ